MAENQKRPAPHPFWQGIDDFENSRAFKCGQHPAYEHGWQTAEQWHLDAEEMRENDAAA